MKSKLPGLTVQEATKLDALLLASRKIGITYDYYNLSPSSKTPSPLAKYLSLLAYSKVRILKALRLRLADFKVNQVPLFTKITSVQFFVVGATKIVFKATQNPAVEDHLNLGGKCLMAGHKGFFTRSQSRYLGIERVFRRTKTRSSKDPYLANTFTASSYARKSSDRNVWPKGFEKEQSFVDYNEALTGIAKNLNILGLQNYLEFNPGIGVSAVLYNSWSHTILCVPRLAQKLPLDDGDKKLIAKAGPLDQRYSALWYTYVWASRNYHRSLFKLIIEDGVAFVNDPDAYTMTPLETEEVEE